MLTWLHWFLDVRTVSVVGMPVVNAKACLDDAAPRKRSNAASQVLSSAAAATDPPAAASSSASSAPAKAIGASAIRCLSASQAPFPASITSFCSERASVTSDESKTTVELLLITR